MGHPRLPPTRLWMRNGSTSKTRAADVSPLRDALGEAPGLQGDAVAVLAMSRPRDTAPLLCIVSLQIDAPLRTQVTTAHACLAESPSHAGRPHRWCGSAASPSLSRLLGWTFPNQVEWIESTTDSRALLPAPFDPSTGRQLPGLDAKVCSGTYSSTQVARCRVMLWSPMRLELGWPNLDALVFSSRAASARLSRAAVRCCACAHELASNPVHRIAPITGHPPSMQSGATHGGTCADTSPRLLCGMSSTSFIP